MATHRYIRGKGCCRCRRNPVTRGVEANRGTARSKRQCRRESYRELQAMRHRWAETAIAKHERNVLGHTEGNGSESLFLLFPLRLWACLGLGVDPNRL